MLRCTRVAPRSLVRRLPHPALLALITLAGCYQSHRLTAPDAGPTPDAAPPEEPCDPAPVCLEDATPICLRVVASRGELTGVRHPACQVFEVVATSDSCEDSAGRVHIAPEAAGIEYVQVDATLVELAPGESFAGHRTIESSPCGACGGGLLVESAEVGERFRFPARAGMTHSEIVFVGRGARYRVVVCAFGYDPLHPDERP